MGFDRGSATLKKAVEGLIGDYVDLYIDFAILEARIGGELAAFEGIRIVKERVRDEAA